MQFQKHGYLGRLKKNSLRKNDKENRNRDEDESPAINSTINRNRGSSGNEEAGNWDD